MRAAGDGVVVVDGAGVAAAEPVSPGNVRTGLDLGGATLQAGAYRYTSSAQLTGALTLDAQGNSSAQFVFEIGSTLTTASASSVVLINGASACNVFWQVGSSATLGSTTAFQGNLMALTDVSLQNGASVNGRVLARNGQISMINNTVSNASCRGTSAAPVTPPAAPVATPRTTPGTSARPKADGTAKMRRLPHDGCSDGFRATVTGRRIKQVVFYRACDAAVLKPRRGPAHFTG